MAHGITFLVMVLHGTLGIGSTPVSLLRTMSGKDVALTRASATTGVEFFLNGVESYNVSTYEGDLGDNNAQQLYVGTEMEHLPRLMRGMG